MFIIPSFKCETLYDMHGSAGCSVGLHTGIYWGEHINEGVMGGACGMCVCEIREMLFFILQEMDMLDIAAIRDTRTGRYAKIPKDPKLRQIVTMGSQDTLEEKTVTVCCGSDFVNLSFINFCCTKKEIAQVSWYGLCDNSAFICI